MNFDFATVAGILGILAFIGSMVVYVRGSYTKTSIEFLRGEVSDLREAFNACKAGREEDRETIADLKGQVTGMEKLLRRIPAIKDSK